MLLTKHPDARHLTAASLYTYPDCPPEIVTVDINNDMVTEVAARLSGGTGPGGNGLSEPPALAPVFCSGEGVVADDCYRLRGVVRQRAAPMARLPGNYEQPTDRTGQAARGQDIWGWGW